MKRLTKPLWIIIVCQAMCLAFGLWIHYHLVISLARWTPTTEALQSSADSDSMPTKNFTLITSVMTVATLATGAVLWGL